MRILITFLIATSVFAQSSNPNNTLKIGNPSSSESKGLIFDTNDGVLNRTLKVDTTTKALNYTGNKMNLGDGASSNNKELVIDVASGKSLKWNGTDNYVELKTDKLRLGNGVAEDVIQEIDLGLGASNPKVKWDNTKGKLVFSNDGVKENAFGTGSGGGGGSNFNNAFGVDDNANAEDGTAGWTASAGTFVASVSDPLEGEQSFNWTPAAQNDTLDSIVLDVDKDIFLGRSCQAQIEYIGGDENLTLQVIDADNDVIGSQVLQAHTITSSESAYFICPSSTATANDKDLRLRLINTGASASALIKFDKSYVGTLIGLTETVLPDTTAAHFTTSVGGCVLTSTSSDAIESCNRISVGKYEVVFKSGHFSVVPSVQAFHQRIGLGEPSQPRTMLSYSATTSSVFVTTKQSDSNLYAEDDFSIIITAQGSDSKQSVQVYKSIPKVSENTNVFGAFVDQATGAVTNKNVDWISCTSGSTGIVSCDITGFNADEAIWGCVAEQNGGVSNEFNCVINYSTPTTIQFRNVRTDSGALADAELHVMAIKGINDFKLPTVQPVIVGQVRNSYAESASKNVRVESCKVSNSGVPVNDSVLCSSWIESYTDSGVGTVSLNFVAGTFSDTPVCSCISVNNVDCANQGTTNNTTFGIRTRVSGTDTLTDAAFFIICQGVK